MTLKLLHNPSSDLLCAEDAGALTDDEPMDHHTASVLLLHSDESLVEFLEGEGDYSPALDYPARFRDKSLDFVARGESVTWILKVCEVFRFHQSTAYLAMNYFDRFLSEHQLPEGNEWALQLLSVACLSIAAKMEETLVPSLLDLQVENARFFFDPRTICKMEILVLTALQWRLRPITPFTFIDFFAYKADPSGEYVEHLVSHATQIILATIHGIEFLEHCPSSMAAAAIICASDETSELGFINPDSAITWCIGMTKEGITNCYHLMQEAGTINKVKLPAKINLNRNPFTNMLNTTSESSSSSPPPIKRRKLN